jgi:hypothetical protein
VVVIVRGILGLFLVLVFLLCAGEARAGQLADRLAQFPHWDSKPPVTAAEGDLVYPDWMEGTWMVTSTLVEQVAPLAPEVVTPGFEGNRRYLNEPINFLVRFIAINPQPSTATNRWLSLKMPSIGRSQMSHPDTMPIVVADRAFNGLNIAKAYLGDRIVQSVKVDPDSPNRQITFLNTGRQLVSIVTDRASEMPDLGRVSDRKAIATPGTSTRNSSVPRFIATEVSNQFFRGTLQPYFNQVETTTAYQLRQSPTLAIEADQITAIYLSPQDPNYFQALDRPVALYRYRLELQPRQ